jgi:hypothetical protein
MRVCIHSVAVTLHQSMRSYEYILFQIAIDAGKRRISTIASQLQLPTVSHLLALKLLALTDRFAIFLLTLVHNSDFPIIWLCCWLLQQVVDAAHRLYTLAIDSRFTAGRRTDLVICACMYVICRREKQPHMLIDFSDVLGINVFILGTTFMHVGPGFLQ